MQQINENLAKHFEHKDSHSSKKNAVGFTKSQMKARATLMKKNTLGEINVKQTLPGIFIRKKLDEEMSMTERNTQKLDNKYFRLLHKSSCEDMKKAIEITCQQFMKRNDCYAKKIENLMSAIKELDQQSVYAHSSHQVNLKEMIRIQENRINDLIHDYTKAVGKMSKKYDDYVKNGQNRHLQKVLEQEEVLFSHEKEFVEQEKRLTNEYEDLKLDISKKNVQAKHMMRIQLQDVTEQYWHMYQKILQQYNEETHDRKCLIQTLKAKDIANSERIEKQLNRIEKLKNMHSALKSKMQKKAFENNNILQKLDQEKDYVYKNYVIVTDILDKKDKLAKVELEKLARESLNSIKKLEETLAIYKEIFTLSELARKMEFENEKILPLGLHCSLTQEEKFAAQRKMLGRYHYNQGAVAAVLQDLENFVRKVATVELSMQTLKMEVENWKMDRKHAIKLIKQYYTDISIGEDLHLQKNKVLQLNQKPIFDSRKEVCLRNPSTASVVDISFSSKSVYREL